MRWWRIELNQPKAGLIRFAASGFTQVLRSEAVLSDTVRLPAKKTSDFWNIFDPSPVRVGCFDDNDRAVVLKELPDIQLTGGAQTELWKASNGFPVLVLEILNVLSGRGKKGEVNSDAMRKACEEIFSSLRDKIASLWEDCPQSCQDLLAHVISKGTVPCDGVAYDAEILIERGFVLRVGNTLQRPNGLLEKYLDERPSESSALARLFGSTENYLQHFRGVLERRIAHIDGLNATLKRYLEQGVQDLPQHPDVFLTHIRGIVNHAFELIWSAELEGKKIPSEWMATWRYNKERGTDDWQTAFPQGVHRVRLLNLMTGTQHSDPCAKCVTKSTYALMNAVHAFGEFGQHQEGASIDPGTGYVVLHLCIELAAALTRELQKNSNAAKPRIFCALLDLKAALNRIWRQL